MRRSHASSQNTRTTRVSRLVAVAAAAGTLALAVPAGAQADPEPRVEAKPRVRVMVPGERQLMHLEAGRRGYLGVHVIELTPDLRRHFAGPDGFGMLVSKVEEGSPAERAGIAVGDVLLAIDREPIASAWDLRRAVGPKGQGDSVLVEVVRDGRPREVTATLEDREGKLLELGHMFHRDGEGRPMIVLPSGQDWEEFGLRMGELGEEMALLGEDVGEEVAGAMAEAFADPEVRSRIRTEVREREALQRQIEVLERRLKELERKLEEQDR